LVAAVSNFPLALNLNKTYCFSVFDISKMLFSLEVLRGALKFTAEERNLKKEEIKS